MTPSQILAEETVDWILQPNSTQKDSLELYRLGLTAEGLTIHNAVLFILRPILCYEKCGDSYLISSRFPRETLLKLALQAVENMRYEPQV